MSRLDADTDDLHETDADDTISLALSPASFVILTAAGGFDRQRGLRPALVTIISSLTQIAVALSEVVSREEYADYVRRIMMDMERAQGVITSENPQIAFDQLLERLRLEHEPSSKTVQ